MYVRPKQRIVKPATEGLKWLIQREDTSLTWGKQQTLLSRAVNRGRKEIDIKGEITNNVDKTRAI